MKNRRKSGHAADAVLQIHSNDYSATRNRRNGDGVRLGMEVTVAEVDWIQIQEINPGITALRHRSRTGRTVRITVICRDARLSGFDLEDMVPDQKSKQELNIEHRSG